MSFLTRNSFYGEALNDEDENNVDSTSMIVTWLNTAALATNAEKVELLKKIQEIILHKDKHLLEVFLDNVLNFCADASPEVRKAIVGFIDETCKTDPRMFISTAQHFAILLTDESVVVQKRAVQAAGVIYKGAIQYLSNVTQTNEKMQRAWDTLCELKTHIIGMIDNDNDGIRTNAVKCLETFVMLQTYADRDLVEEKKKTIQDFSLDNIPIGSKILRRRILEEQAIEIFQVLLNFFGSQYISSVNLIACMGTLCAIGRQRPQFIHNVVTAFESRNTSLPPTLSASQEVSVRKHLKLMLFTMLKHPSGYEVKTNLIQLLTSLGVTHSEIQKAIPKLDKNEERRRQKRIMEREFEMYNKKIKLDNDPELISDEKQTYPAQMEDTFLMKSEGLDINERFIFERLQNIESVVNFVMYNMSKLPDVIPSAFLQNYTPIINTGSPQHVRNLAKMLTQKRVEKILHVEAPSKSPVIIEEPPIIGVKVLTKVAEKRPAERMDADHDEIEDESKKLKEARMEMGSKLKQKVKSLKLQEITKPLNRDAKDKLLLLTVERILQTERQSILGGVTNERSKIITTLAASFTPHIRQTVLEYILSDIRNRLDLAFSWLYEEYSLLQGFTRQTFVKPESKPDHNYNSLLCAILDHIIKSDYRDKENILSKIYLAAPAITDEALNILVNICRNENTGSVGLRLLSDIILKRPPKQNQCLNALLCFTIHDNNILRQEAINNAIKLFKRSDNIANQVEDRANTFMCYLTLPHPPEQLFSDTLGRPNFTEIWSEDLYKVCLYLYLAILPINEVLIHELARVYVQAGPDSKRIILKLLESAIRSMGMDNLEILRLIENCIKGAEILVTRILHILTERTPPSIELVKRVRDLYQHKGGDVRFLIPVINGLSKKEVINALPKLIKLNPVVVKEVFNRLLITTHPDGTIFPSPVTPAELLVALHVIDTQKVEIKFIIKATSLCFAEKEAFTQEELAVVIQQLMEITPLPTLLMRTVIQALSLYPRLSGFVMNILQRLILKQVWKQKVVWDGFLKCCQRSKPQSSQVLLQLPPQQLTDALEACPDLRAPLKEHVLSFNENQKAHVPQSILEVTMVDAPLLSPSEIKIEPVSSLTTLTEGPPGLE